MTSRQIRRAAERSKNKQNRPTELSPVAANEPVSNQEATPQGLGEPEDFSSDSEPPIIVPDQEHIFCHGRSTGPRTPEGKARSSMNNLRHGLTGTFYVLADESPAKFEDLLTTLIEEHAPVTPTELILVEKMAEHLWLSRRAQRMQDGALGRDDVKNLMLFLRYQTTNDRAFYRALTELRALRKHALQFESHEARVRLVNARAHTIEQETEIRGRIEAPIPGNSAIPFDIAKRIMGESLTLAHTQYKHFEARKNQKN